MSKLNCPVYMGAPVAEIPTSTAYPKRAMLDAFGRYHFTSSLAWMFALALSQDGVEEIGLWGVDMSATEEYGFQRAGCQHFMELARSRGVKVTVPPESDLDCPPPLYGLGETHPMRIKLTARKAEIEAKMAQAAADAEQHKAAHEEAIRLHLFFQGALEDLNYTLNTWCE